MTVLSLQWLAVRPRRRIALPRHLRAAAACPPPAACPPAQPEPRTYRDPFFADPTLVEDDARRFSR